MLRIEDIPSEETRALLRRVGFGHLGCTRDGNPYVVPMHYGYDGQDLYFLTTEGTITEFIPANSKVCFQVEEVTDATRWQSVMVMGRAQRLTVPDEVERAMQCITDHHPTLTPALNKTDIGAWHRLNNIAIYRVRPEEICGRRTAHGGESLKAGALV